MYYFKSFKGFTFIGCLTCHNASYIAIILWFFVSIQLSTIPTIANYVSLSPLLLPPCSSQYLPHTSHEPRLDLYFQTLEI